MITCGRVHLVPILKRRSSNHPIAGASYLMSLLGIAPHPRRLYRFSGLCQHRLRYRLRTCSGGFACFTCWRLGFRQPGHITRVQWWRIFDAFEMLAATWHVIVPLTFWIKVSCWTPEIFLQIPSCIRGAARRLMAQVGRALVPGRGSTSSRPPWIGEGAGSCTARSAPRRRRLSLEVSTVANG
jgi:hypothetical protein